MRPPQDPPRLLDASSDAPASLRSALEAGARDVPSAARLAGIAARLPGGWAGGPTGSGSSPPRPPVPPVPALPSVLSGAAVGAALGLAVVGVGWLASPRAAEPPPARPASIAAVATSAPEAPRFEPAKAPRPGAPARLERPAPLPNVTASAAEPAATEPTAAGSLEPIARDQESESSILKRALDALRGDPAQALAITDLHVARYPGGALAQEREVLAVSALLGMGRRAEARARATRFLASFPTSVHRGRLEVLIPDLQSSTGDHKDSSDGPSTR
jgi:hypothetical protein